MQKVSSDGALNLALWRCFTEDVIPWWWPYISYDASHCRSCLLGHREQIIQIRGAFCLQALVPGRLCLNLFIYDSYSKRFLSFFNAFLPFFRSSHMPAGLHLTCPKRWKALRVLVWDACHRFRISKKLFCELQLRSNARIPSSSSGKRTTQTMVLHTITRVAASWKIS